MKLLTFLLSLLLLLLLLAHVHARIEIYNDKFGWCTNAACDTLCTEQKFNFGTCEWYLLVRSRCLCAIID
ncbi:unnamed protein product [Caenorhabditis sp. 36 PRJEB53466]|nr:unnamed protein product [Caenorhabditis sp. 36 PRJEB53466]